MSSHRIRNDNLGKDGCCLICKKTKSSCIKPCLACKCSKCFWYQDWNGKCGYPFFKKRDNGTGYPKKGETKKAVLLLSEFGEDWFPKSQSEVTKNKKGKEFYWIPRWLLERKGWMKEKDWIQLNNQTIEEYERKYLKTKSFRPSLEDIKHW